MDVLERVINTIQYNTIQVLYRNKTTIMLTAAIHKAMPLLTKDFSLVEGIKFSRTEGSVAPL
jgi:hypothetical protein